MIILPPNPAQVVLEATLVNFDGSPNNSGMSAANVRVYYVSAGSEVDVLATTALVQVGGANVWRYVWAPSSLPQNQYFAEYSFTDLGGAPGFGIEEIDVLTT